MHVAARASIFLFAATIGTSLACCAVAHGANVMVGNPLLPGSYSDIVGCPREKSCTFANLALPPAAGWSRSPVEGAIVRWTLRGVSGGSGYAIRVLRPAGQELGYPKLAGVGTSAPVVASAWGADESFETVLPVKVGDLIGLNLPSGGRIGMMETPGSSHGYFAPALPDGADHLTGQFTGELPFNAEVQPVPTITRIDRTSDTTSGGATIHIAGNDFRGVTGVRFGTASAASYSVDSDQSLTAVDPGGAPGSVHISVTTIAGSSPVSANDLFEYVEPPQTIPLPQAPNCIVPHLIGVKLSVARRRVRRADCQLRSRRKRESGRAIVGHVVRQRPPPGTTEPSGSKIVVTVG
jgi:IPT/TIG domain